MERARRFVLILLTAALSCCAGQAPNSALADALLGKWGSVRTTDCCARYEQSIEFGADGSFHAAGMFRDASGSTPYSYDGQWKVEAGYLSFNVKSGGLARPDFPRGEYRERILSLTELELVTAHPGTGEEYRAWKYPK